MQMKDYITITISVISLIFSLTSIIFTFLNYKRNMTKLKINQLNFRPNPFETKATPNKLFLDRRQSTDMWTIVPIVHLVIYLKIDNLSYTGITISNIIINDTVLITKMNMEALKEELSLCFFASKECSDRDFKEYGHSVNVAVSKLQKGDYSLINIGDRIESKSCIEGIVIISGNWDLYNCIKDGVNKLTIATPDKNFDSYVKIDKTVIPNCERK